MIEIKDLNGKVLIKISWADLRGAVLCGAVLCGANLRGADLSGAVLRGAVLRGAKIADKTNLPSPTMVLLASWGNVSDPLCKALMRFDANNHPRPEAFLEWAKGGGCPYADINIERSANFHEKKGIDYCQIPELKSKISL